MPDKEFNGTDDSLMYRVRIDATIDGEVYPYRRTEDRSDNLPEAMVWAFKDFLLPHQLAKSSALFLAAFFEEMTLYGCFGDMPDEVYDAFVDAMDELEKWAESK